MNTPSTNNYCLIKKCDEKQVVVFSTTIDISVLDTRAITIIVI